MDFTPKGIVVHTMGQYIDWKGELIFAPDFLDKIGYGANGFIQPDGEYIEGKPKGFKTNHAGKSYHKEKNLMWLNSKYNGYELLLEGVTNYSELLYQMYNNPTLYSEEQYLTLARVCYKDMKAFGFDESFIVGHDEVSGIDVRGEDDYKHDPGPFFDWDKLRGYIEMEKYK